MPKDELKVPLFGNLAGVTLPDEPFEITQGITLRPTYAYMFGAPMLAFRPPLKAGSHHPAPVAAVNGGFGFENRVEIELGASDRLSEYSPSTLMWLVVALLRLQVSVPIRLTTLSNFPHSVLKDGEPDAEIFAFEDTTSQIGLYNSKQCELSDIDLDWLKTYTAIICRMYQEDRFNRAFSIYEQAQWSRTLDTALSMAWSSLEILFDIGSEWRKTEALCRSLSDYVTLERSDRDRAYQVIQELAYKRGQIVHSGHRAEWQDTAQVLNFAKVAFRRVLIDEELPCKKD